MATAKENLHEHHRLRMKARFLKEGFKGFSEHEKLEMLLFYAVPRQNTNETGHELLRRFGSISKVLEADVSELCKVKGISEHSAILFKIVLSMCESYVLDKTPHVDHYEYDEMGRFFCSYYAGKTKESLSAVYLDNAMNVIRSEQFSEGDVNIASIDVKRLVTSCINCGASSVVLAHNHPSGVVIPSSDDIEANATLAVTLNMLNITLVEHYIVSDDTYSGIVSKIVTRTSDTIKDLFIKQ